MKLLHTVIITTFLFLSFNLLGQTIMNNGFEDWTTIQYFEEPDGYFTTNALTYFGNGQENVTKSTDAFSGNFALHLETIASDDGPIPGAAYIGQIGEDFILGGIPYTQRPDAVTGQVKFNTTSLDSAYVAVIFKKFGAPLGLCIAVFNGVQNDYVSFSQPVEWLLPIISPDTVAIVLVSSSIFGIPEEGNSITMDQLAFEGASDPFPNGDFENWNSFESEEPDSWLSSNVLSLPASEISVTKTSDSYEGDFAARIESTLTFSEDTLGFITNGSLGDDGLTGGMAVDDVPDILSGYYKYIPEGPDTALAALTLFAYNEGTGNSEVIDEVYQKLPPADEYTYFEVEVDYYSLPEPDTVNIAFASGNIDEEQGYIGLGSVLYVDDLEITFKPHIVDVAENDKQNAPKVYPNPVTDNLYFEIRELINEPANVTIFNSTGKVVYTDRIRKSGIRGIQVNQFTRGLYFYRLEIGQKMYNGKFIVE